MELIFSGIRDLLLAPALFRLAGRLSWRSARSCARIVQTLRWSPARPTRLWRSPSALAASCIRADAQSPANLRAVLCYPLECPTAWNESHAHLANTEERRVG